MDASYSGFVFYFETTVILCNILFFVVIWILLCLGYVTISFARKRTNNSNWSEVGNTHQKHIGSNAYFNGGFDSEKSLTQQGLTEVEKPFEQLQAGQLKVLQKELGQERSRITTLRTELNFEKEQKEQSLKRLSAIMSSRLRDGNPNVVDLSDINRPVKIGEQFSELYDNQWTDAYGAVQLYFGQNMQEADIVKLLLDILKQCFIVCKEQADRQMSLLSENVGTIAIYITKKTTRLPEDLMQRIKEERKIFATGELPEYCEILPQVKEYFSQRHMDTDFLDASELEMFVQECLKLCWLMVVQDPPMAMIQEPVKNASDEFKAYKHRGNHVAFIVWPALLLEERGAVLTKGVAEFHD